MFFIFYFFVFIFGLVIGSFLNCLIYRLPNKISLTPQPPLSGGQNRSFCPKCKEQIGWYDNIPVLSFIFLKGKCRNCGCSISLQYLLVELATGILFLAAWHNELRIMNYELWPLYSDSIIHNSLFIIQILRDWFLISAMIVIFAIDLKHYLILDIVALPAAAVVFILNLFLGFSWLNLVLAGLIGGGFFLIQFLISKGKWIGGGDIRLGLLMGFALGFPNVLVALFLAYFIGSFVGVGMILSGKKQWSSQIPMGTFLSVTTIIALFWGGKILSWYLGLF